MSRSQWDRIPVMAHRGVLLVGGHRYDLEEARSGLDPALDVDLHVAESLDELVQTVSTRKIDTVVFDADIGEDERLEMIQRLIADSIGASIHVLTRSADLAHLMSFVNGVLTGLTWHQWTWTAAGDSGDRQVSTLVKTTPRIRKRVGYFRRIWDYFFGRSEPPVRPPPPPYTPGAM